MKSQHRIRLGNAIVKQGDYIYGAIPLRKWEKLVKRALRFEEWGSKDVFECKCCNFRTTSILRIRLHWKYDEYHLMKYPAYKKEQDRLYYQKNKETIKKQQQQYRAKNRDKINERARAYRLKNGDKMRERERLYRAKNRHAIKINNDYYYVVNRDKINERKRAHRLKNKGRYKCEPCSYSTYSKYNYNRHLHTKKHKTNTTH